MKERNGSTGENAVKGHKDDKGTRASLLQEKYETWDCTTWRRLRRGSHQCLQISEWRACRGQTQSLFRGQTQSFFSNAQWQYQRQWAQAVHRWFCLNIEDTFSMWEWLSTGTVSQRSCGVSIHRDILNAGGHGPSNQFYVTLLGTGSLDKITSRRPFQTKPFCEATIEKKRCSA